MTNNANHADAQSEEVALKRSKRMNSAIRRNKMKTIKQLIEEGLWVQYFQSKTGEMFPYNKENQELWHNGAQWSLVSEKK